jgi:hypothetical protein
MRKGRSVSKSIFWLICFVAAGVYLYSIKYYQLKCTDRLCLGSETQSFSSSESCEAAKIRMQQTHKYSNYTCRLTFPISKDWKRLAGWLSQIWASVEFE